MNRSTLYLFIQLIKGGEIFGGRVNASSLESSGRQTPSICMYLTMYMSRLSELNKTKQLHTSRHSGCFAAILLN